MNAPDRFEAVTALVAQHPEVFAAERHDENRRAFLPTICTTLNLIERANGNPEGWGVLVKGDRTPAFIPCDILAWAPSGEIIDVLTGTGAAWINHGPMNLGSPLWAWAVAAVVPPDGSSTPRDIPGPPPPPPPDDEDDKEHVERFLETLERIYDGLAGLAEGIAALARMVARLETEGVRMRFK